MNLDDYSYELEGRRYINPQVSLDEQNAFIDNLRNAQAQDNAQIEKQTYGLGMQVPSNRGGLSGGSSYFKSRYQTPQTNQAVMDLKTAAQSQALNTVLNNILAQEQKKYKDAYRAAQERSSNNGASDTKGLFDKASGLKIETNSNSNLEGEKIPGGGSDTISDNTATLPPYAKGVNRFRNNGFEWLYDSSDPYVSASSPLNNAQNGTITEIQGRPYIMVDGQWYPVVKSPF